MASPGTNPWLKIFLGGALSGVILLGVAIGAMLQTDRRPFCASCHIMQEAAVTHKGGTHADLACNDCHAPHRLMSKLPFKLRAGLADFSANLAGKDVSPPSMGTRGMVNENCIACHARTNVNVASMNAKPYCVDCHRNIAHMRQKPIAERTVAHD